MKAKAAKPEYGDYTPSAKKQEEIDSLINAAVRKAFGKVVAKVECIGIRQAEVAVDWSELGRLRRRCPLRPRSAGRGRSHAFILT